MMKDSKMLLMLVPHHQPSAVHCLPPGNCNCKTQLSCTYSGNGKTVITHTPSDTSPKPTQKHGEDSKLTTEQKIIEKG